MICFLIFIKVMMYRLELLSIAPAAFYFYGSSLLANMQRMDILVLHNLKDYEENVVSVLSQYNYKIYR
uniref:Uncharacterized protein n=1 Tax=Picea sitchensis TaxID=3332 RepID=D5ADW0_PICSI|nr:unknown [Picea sitchensis]